jgi:hypothetical protein
MSISYGQIREVPTSNALENFVNIRRSAEPVSLPRSPNNTEPKVNIQGFLHNFDSFTGIKVHSSLSAREELKRTCNAIKLTLTSGGTILVVCDDNNLSVIVTAMLESISKLDKSNQINWIIGEDLISPVLFTNWDTEIKKPSFRENLSSCGQNAVSGTNSITKGNYKYRKNYNFEGPSLVLYFGKKDWSNGKGKSHKSTVCQLLFGIKNTRLNMSLNLIAELSVIRDLMKFIEDALVSHNKIYK